MPHQTKKGEIWMDVKADHQMFSIAWTQLDARNDLTTDERNLLDTIHQFWFEEGWNFFAYRESYLDFLQMCWKYDQSLLERPSKPRGGGPERQITWTTPMYDAGFKGSQWPKERTKKMGSMTDREYRAEYRRSVRDAERARMAADVRVYVDQRDRIAQLEQNQAALLDLVEQLGKKIDALGKPWLGDAEVDLAQYVVH
jgi:hypothetical protein